MHGLIRVRGIKDGTKVALSIAPRKGSVRGSRYGITRMYDRRVRIIETTCVWRGGHDRSCHHAAWRLEIILRLEGPRFRKAISPKGR